MALTRGQEGNLYCIAESTYGVAPALSATNAMRHITFTAPFNNFNRGTVLEKTGGGGHSVNHRTTRRKTASWNLEMLLRSSDVLNTLSEIDPVLLAGFGARSNVTLNTTFSGVPTVSDGTVASAAGLVVGDMVAITCPDGKVRLRRVTTAGVNLAWAPNLPAGQAPIAGAACKGVTTYKLTTQITSSLAFAYYRRRSNGSEGLGHLVTGAGVDKLSIDFMANEEPRIKASGQAKHVIAPPSRPGGFTFSGGVPPSGIVGDLMIGNTPMKFTKLGLEIRNERYFRMDEYGDDSSVEVLRGGRRSVGMSLEAYHEDEATLYNFAIGGTFVPVFKQTGYTEGKCFAIYAPQVDFAPPAIDDPDDMVSASYQGAVLESADAANDEVVLAIG